MTGPACRERPSRNKAAPVTKHPRESAAGHVGYGTAARSELAGGLRPPPTCRYTNTMRRVTVLLLVVATAALMAPAVAGASKLIGRPVRILIVDDDPAIRQMIVANDRVCRRRTQRPAPEMSAEQPAPWGA